MAYKAKQGDIVWIDLDPQVGSEIKGRRPSLIVSNNQYNDNTAERAMVCPITNTNRGWPSHINLAGTRTTGVVMCDQAKVLDIKKRNADFIESIPAELLEEIVGAIGATLEISADKQEFAVMIEMNAEGRFSAYVPEFLDCSAQGEDLDDVLMEIKSTIEKRLNAHAKGDEHIYNPNHFAVITVEI